MTFSGSVACGVTLLALAAASAVQAQAADTATATATTQLPSVDELVKLKQNPVSGLKQILLEANINPGYPQSGDTQGIYSLQAVWPFSLGENYRLVSYTILPLVHLPEAPDGGSVTGLSDTLVNLFVSPKKAGSVIWGLGPSILLPTRTDLQLGTNRVGLGPAALIFFPQKTWSFGLVLQNNWSLGGEGTNKVNAFGAQYLFSYNLPNGWSVYSNATISANWLRDSGDRWTVPVGGGVGKLFVAGKQPISVSLQAFYNVVTPTDGPKWSMNFQLAFLFAAPQ